MNDVDAINTAVRSALKAMRYKQMVYAPVATQQANTSIALAAEQLRKLAALTATDLTDASTIPPKLSLIRDDAQKRLDGLSSLNPAYQVDAASITKDINDADSFAKSAKIIAEQAQAVQKIAAQIGVNPDPPIDSELHSVQFVLAYGASVMPSWTMIQWKGPALNGPAASGQGQRTHILQLALGPPHGERQDLCRAGPPDSECDGAAFTALVETDGPDSVQTPFYHRSQGSFRCRQW